MPITASLAEFNPPFYNNFTMLSLDALESRIQTLLEVHLLKFLPGYKPEDMIFKQLAVAMHKSLKVQDGITYAPNIYVILTHPNTLARWHTSPHLLEQLAEVLYKAGEDAGFHFLIKPMVSMAVDPDIKIDKVLVISSFSSENIPETQELQVDQPSNSPKDGIPPNAFLILGGTKIVPLNRPVFNLGRRLDNQIVIDDPRISRTHAQLRIAKGHYVIFDLDSTGGTFINGRRVVQSVLNPGDVISLAGVTLIFSQDLPSKPDVDAENTKPGSTISTDGSNAVVHQPKKRMAKKAPEK